jgi:hypothetical protein
MTMKMNIKILLSAIFFLSGITIVWAQSPLQKQIIFETNSGYQDLTSTKKTTFVSYKIPLSIASGEFFENRRMITEQFMAGVNFSSASAVLILEQFWNGVKVQQCIVTPTLSGAPKFETNQNRPLDIRTQVRRESGTLLASTLRNHSYWQTDFEHSTFFGHGDEFSWGNTVVDLNQEILVEWKYSWSVENCHFYFDHLKVEY